MGLKRRAHRKSRSGCTECKRRRIKCSEEQPQCKNCARHDISCVYPPKAATQSNHSPTGHTPPQSPSSYQSTLHVDSPETRPYYSHHTNPAHTSQAFFELKDLALLHHWTLVTSRSIINTPQLDHFWQTTFPQIAFNHPHVMHSILSLAALHIAYLQPSNSTSFLRNAAHHHTEALQGFREDINSIGLHNSDALFASATLSFFYAFLTFGKLHDNYGEDATPAARTSRVLGAEWLPLVRGFGAVLDPVHRHVSNGPLRSLLNLRNWDELDFNVHPGPDDDHLLRVQEIWLSDEHADVYRETLNILRKCSAWMAQFQLLHKEDQSKWGYNRDWSGPFIWLFLAPDRYFVLQSQRQPPALILFAYFGALLHRLDRYWWIEGCAKSIISVVVECLGPYWSPWLQWPKQTVGIN